MNALPFIGSTTLNGGDQILAHKRQRVPSTLELLPFALREKGLGDEGVKRLCVTRVIKKVKLN